MPVQETPIQLAAQLIANSEALLICAGAGMGVDSGLPDFRSPGGFWRAYPLAQKLGLSFEEMANATWFDKDPQFAWGFYGHRLNLYRKTMPHEGFSILRRWAEKKPHAYFVYTSNVDGHFQKAGFEEGRIVECHGSVHLVQCSKPCCAATWPLPLDVHLEVEESELRAKGALPTCISCKGPARPNVLMFSDANWMDGRSAAQQIRLRLWLRNLSRGKLAVIELGAGSNLPAVRNFSEQVARAAGNPLIRINPLESRGPDNCVSIREGALEALRGIDQEMAKLGSV